MDLRRAVKKTLAYSAFFKFPLSPQETHFWLISPRPISFSSSKKYFPVLKQKDNKIREALLKNTLNKKKLATKFIRTARFLPGIRLIALTGSVAANNSKKNDDLDLLIVTSPHSVWLVRPLLLLLLSLKFNRRHPGDNPTKTQNAFCPNLWIDTLSLSVPKKRRNLYTAHEVLQIKPLLNRGQTYQHFLKSNHWTRHFLANAYKKLQQGKLKKQRINPLIYLIAPINFFLFLLQYLYMLPKKTSEVVSLHSAYFHKKDFSSLLHTYLRDKSL
ncbi:MAG TPA: hypothetical protein VLH94_02570 [Spirochaetia bacterium]|nr:hypothetical protein [Spirochaetia bacterium]